MSEKGSCYSTEAFTTTIELIRLFQNHYTSSIHFHPLIWFMVTVDWNLKSTITNIERRIFKKKINYYIIVWISYSLISFTLSVRSMKFEGLSRKWTHMHTYVFHVLLWLKYGFMRLCHLLHSFFVFTFYTISKHISKRLQFTLNYFCLECEAV